MNQEEALETKKRYETMPAEKVDHYAFGSYRHSLGYLEGIDRAELLEEALKLYRDYYPLLNVHWAKDALAEYKEKK